MSKFPPKLRPEIPKLPLTLKGGCRHFFKAPKDLSIDVKKAPYTNGELAWIKANHEALQSYRRQIVSIITTIITLVFFLTQTSSLLPLSERAHFLAAPFNQIGFVIYWYACFFLFGVLVLFLFVILVGAVVLFILDPKITVKTVRDHDWLEGVREFDLHRTFPYFAAQTIGLVNFLWIIQALFQIEFTVHDPSGSVMRMLSGFEFLYVFFVSYTTLGYGDIVPHSYGARCIFLVINCYTIFSIVYWYGPMAKGPRRSKVREHLKRLYRKHRKRIEGKRDSMRIAMTVLTKFECGDLPFCPLYLNKRHNRKPCPLCNGTNRVSEDVFFAYAVRNDYKYKTFLQKVPGLNKTLFKELLKFLNGK